MEKLSSILIELLKEAGLPAENLQGRRCRIKITDDKGCECEHTSIIAAVTSWGAEKLKRKGLTFGIHFPWLVADEEKRSSFVNLVVRNFEKKCWEVVEVIGNRSRTPKFTAEIKFELLD